MDDISIITLIYDGECRFCCKWINYWTKKVNIPNLKPLSFQQINIKDYNSNLSLDDVRKEIYLFYNQKTYRGAEAVFYLYYLGGYKLLYRLFLYLPGFSLISKIIYHFIAKNRYFFSKFLVPTK